MLLNSIKVLVIFPIWNIINGCILLGALRGGVLSEKNVRDENVELGEVITGTIVVSFVFFICYFLFQPELGNTFSICIAWVTTLNSTINSILLKQQTIKY